MHSVHFLRDLIQSTYCLLAIFINCKNSSVPTHLSLTCSALNTYQVVYCYSSYIPTTKYPWHIPPSPWLFLCKCLQFALLIYIMCIWEAACEFQCKDQGLLHCLWKEILSQPRIRHFKILQSIYFTYDVGIISSYSNRILLHCRIHLNSDILNKLKKNKKHQC